MGTPVYGEIDQQGYLEYMAPGVVVSICYIMATGLTALAFIIEKRGEYGLNRHIFVLRISLIRWSFREKSCGGSGHHSNINSSLFGADLCYGHSNYFGIGLHISSF